MPMTFALLAPFAIAVAAFMLSLGFFLGTCWAAIHNGDDEPPLRDSAIRAGRPLSDMHIDRFEYVPDGRRLRLPRLSEEGPSFGQ
jgi:predicted membrane metal-binding protein